MVTKTDSALSIGVDFTANLESSPGRIDVDGVVEASEEQVGPLTLFLRGPGEANFDVRWVPVDNAEVSNEITNIISDQINRMDDLINTFPPGVVSRPQDFLPERVSNIFVIETVTITSDSPGEFSESFSFPRAQVLVRRQGDIIERLPSVPVTIEAKPSSAIENFIAGSVNDIPQVTFDISPRVFIEEVPLSRFDCGVLFGDIDSVLAQTEQQVSAALERARTRTASLNNLLDDIISTSGVSITTEADGGFNVDELPISQLREVTDETISQWRSRLNSISADVTPGTTIDTLMSTTERLGSRIQDEVGLNRCVGSLADIVQGLESDLSELETLQSRLSNLRSSMDTLLTRLGARRTRLRPLEELPCEQRFSSIDRRIDRWENQVSRLSSPTVSETRSLIMEGENISGDIRGQVDDEDCVQEFMRRVEGGLNRLESMITQVRITAEDGRVEQRRQQVEALRRQIEELVQQLEE